MTIYNDHSHEETEKKKVQAAQMQDTFMTATEEEDVFAVTFDISDRVSKF